MAASVLAEGLTGRLAQRGSEPLGVIDVHRPQQHYTRMAGWFGQRLPLLNQLLARYSEGGEHGAGAGGFIYRMAHSFPPETPTASTLENSFSPAAGIARPIPIQSVTTAGNARPPLADAVLSTGAVSGSSSELPGTATAAATVAQPADLTPSGKISLGRVGIAHLAPAAITRTATGMSARPLPERLAQRGSEPLGAIDVRQPQQHYVHSAGWLGQRLPLLHQLLTRYYDGGEHGAGAGGFTYRATPSFPPNLSNASGASSDLPGMATATAAQPAAPTPAGKVSLGTVGIAHPTPAADLTSSGNVSLGTVGIAHPTPAVTATAAETELPAGTTATVAQPAGLASSAPASVELAAASPAMTLRVRRQAPPLADAVSTLVSKTFAETTAAGRTGPAAGIPNQAATPSPLPASEAMENLLAASGVRLAASLPLATGLQAPLPVRPRSMARPLAGTGPIAGAKRLPELQPTTARLEPVIARKAVDTVSSTSDARIDATATAVTLAPTHAGLPASMPLARRTAALPLSESITGTADKPALPLILEKPAAAAAAPVPGLVWRKSIITSTTAGAGNPAPIDAVRMMAVAAYPADGGLSSTASPIMRAESTNPPADNQPGASSPASMPSRATALDWESLFNQFSRRLLRQLAIERERRGGKGWS